MILQRNTKLKIWGWADPGESVMVSFRGRDYQATANDEGEWMVILDPQLPGMPAQMDISASNHITLSNILFGDVWLCSGQSNMTHAFNRWQEEYATEIAESENSKIRQFYVPTTAVLTGPLQDIPGQEWKEANPENLLNFTVVGYFFAKKLYDRYQVPQGIIMSCVGGTRIEAWTSEDGFKEFPEQLETIEKNKDTEYVERVNAAAKADRESNPPIQTVDAGLAGEIKWFDPNFKPLNWKPINIPGYWEDQGIRNLDGVVWYRREIDIPESLAGKRALVKLGRIRNADDLYVNGQRFGGTGYEYPQRRYTIPPDILKPGKNLFVVRVSNQWGPGGFIPDKPYQVEIEDHIIDLKGLWHYRVGEVYRPSPQYKQGINAQSQPASLFNGMIAPLTNYSIRGALWYQGESNAGEPDAYREYLPNLVENWRHEFDNPDLSFLIAQLPRYMEVDYLPVTSNWALMREVQMDTALEMKNVGTGINIDLGEWNDIHPGRKKPVGERLALRAMELSYGDNSLVPSGPIFNSQKIVGDKIELSFDYVGSGLVSNNGEKLAHFAIAGKDKKFVWADAKIDGDKVVVWSDEVPEPEYVRYAWADNPDFANLGNEEGLPASPFRTDR